MRPNNPVPNSLAMEFNWLTFNGKSGPDCTPMIVREGAGPGGERDAWQRNTPGNRREYIRYLRQGFKRGSANSNECGGDGAELALAGGFAYGALSAAPKKRIKHGSALGSGESQAEQFWRGTGR